MAETDRPIEAQEPAAPGVLHGLGRLASKDERDKRFRMAAPRTNRIYRMWFSLGSAWDQGNTSQCVAYAVNRYLHSHPVCNKPILPHSVLYKESQRRDEWTGEDYEGTSARGAFKYLKERGVVTSYGWADEAEMVARHVLEYGPVPIGTDWTDGMGDTDSKGYIWPIGENWGGHETLLLGFSRNRVNPDETRGAFRGINSWGSWGDKGSGRYWLTFDSLNKLLHGLFGWPGDAVSATEVKVLS